MQVSPIFNSTECQSCMERKFNSECKFVGLKNNGLIYRCRECEEECERSIEGLIRKFASVYQFCNGDLNEVILLLRKGFYLMKIWMTEKNLMKPQYHLKKPFTAN